jgi:restriction system protein
LALWVLKADLAIEEEREWLGDSSIAVGWRELPDLSTCQDREALTAAYRRTYPSVRGARLVRDVSQLYAFAHEMRRGDLVAFPLYLGLPIAIGEIAGDYVRAETSSARPHRRAVRWLATDVPRSEWDADLVLALDSPMTLHRVRRRSAEERVRSVVSERASQADQRSSLEPFEERARRAILERIRRTFPGDRLADLVQAIFGVRGAVIANGNHSPSARDTLLAVASETKPASARLYVSIAPCGGAVDEQEVERFARQLASRDVDQGLLVALRGFTPEARRASFELSRVTLWNAADLIDATLSNYDQLPERFREAIPLKRIWVVAPHDPTD